MALELWSLKDPEKTGADYWSEGNESRFGLCLLGNLKIYILFVLDLKNAGWETKLCEINAFCISLCATNLGQCGK